MAKTTIKLLPIEKLHLSDKNVRDVNTDVQLLVESIRSVGLLTPIIVRKIDENNYEVVAGSRRYRACKSIGFKLMPCMIVEVDDLTAVEISLIENVQREKMTLEEEVDAILKLLEIHGDNEKLSKPLGIPVSEIEQKIKAIRLKNEIKIPVVNSPSFEEKINGVLDFRLASLLYDTMKELNMSVEDTKELARKISTMSLLSAKNYIETNNKTKKSSDPNRILIEGIEVQKSIYDKLLKLADEEGMSPEEYVVNKLSSNVRWRYYEKWGKKKKTRETENNNSQLPRKKQKKPKKRKR